ncbi:MAG: hypothetical protein K0S09_701 [Sphingobacteriaceae bacterium]|jgi:TonB-linked SusC/RagA family outer membrane protein|nr:hypothetical protein [Sphingobacteriaceae bacterium]
MKNLYKILLSVLFLYGPVIAQAQTRVVTGVVKDDQGTLPGITILEKSTPTNGVVTDVEGKFRITLHGNSNVIIVKSLGYVTKEVNVAGKQNVSVTLAMDARGLEDVVVVGYGTQKKIDVTGSISTVTRNDIQQTPSASIQNALTGKLPGFFSQQRSGRPGDDGAEFFVRGISTFGPAQTPLILVDDIEFSYDDFSNIDPNEVQSLSILKDAAATAVYGVKGANGVILVTTRRGQVGAPRVNFRTEFGLQMPMHVPKILDAANMAILRNEALKNDATISGGAYTPDFTDADIELFRNGQDPYGHPNIDWYNTLFKKTAPINKNNLDLSGGSDAVQYFVSMGYETQDGILRDFKGGDEVDNNFRYNRFNFRSNVDIKANKSLSFKFDFSGANAITNQPQIGTGVFGEIYNYEGLTPFVYPIYNPNGSFGFTDPNRPQPGNNVVGRISTGGYDRERQNIMSLNGSVIQKLDFLTKGLSAKAMVSLSNSNKATRSQTVSNFPSFYYNPTTGTYTPRNANIYRVDPYSLSYAPGLPRRQSTIQAHLNYGRSFGNHNVNALVLYNQNTKVKAVLDNNDVETERSYIPENFRGVSSRLAYNFSNKYLIEFNGSYNGSDRFAEGHRFGFFPAVSGGWVLSEENFIKKNAEFISLFKLRGSWGIVGSDYIKDDKNSYEELYTRGGAYSFGETNKNYTSIVPGSLANLNVTWEKERKAEIATDFALFNGKVSGTAAVFDNKRYDILANRNTVPSYFGVQNAQLPPLNLGIVSNKGYEFELVYNGKIGKDFGFNLKGNYSYAKNKILEIDEVPPRYEYQRQTGRSVGEVQGFIWDGYYSVAEAADPSVPKYIGSTTAAGGPGTTLPGFLKYRDLNGDGVITDDDRGYFGDSNLPTTIIGFATGFTYKRVSLNVLLQAGLGSDVQIGYNFSVPFKGNLQAIHLDRWTPETAATATFPALVSNFHGTYMTTASNSSFWAVSGNYLRVKSVELGYKVPENFATAIGLKGLRVYANAYNLMSWSKVFNRYGVDPEVARGGGNNGYVLPYPQSAIFNLGLNVSVK